MRKLKGPELLFVGCGGDKSVMGSDMEKDVNHSCQVAHAVVDG